jgi:hypothetical protein
MRITVMLSILADRRKLASFFIPKRKNLPEAKCPTGITLKCNEKGCMMEEIMVEWLREGWHRRPSALPTKKRNAGFRSFQGPLNRGSQNCSIKSTKHGSSDHTRKYGLSVIGSSCGS